METDFISTRARYSSDDIAVIDPNKDRKWTYAEINERAENLAIYLIHIGITEGDRVALFSPNDVAYFDLLFACTKIGAITVPINWRLKPNEIQLIIKDCGAKAIFYASNHRERLNDLSDIQLVDIDSEEYNSICESGKNKNFNSVQIEKNSPAIILYTSGTTGMPKGVVISHNGMLQNGMNAVLNWNFENSDITFASAPMFHIAGLCATVIPFMMIGATIVIQRYFEPKDAIKLIQEYKITHLFMVPTMYHSMLNTNLMNEESLKSVRKLISGGAPPSEYVFDKFDEIGKTVINSYGLTEAGPHNFRILPEEAAKNRKSIGKPIMFISVRIVDDKFQDVPDGESGELLIAGEHVCDGYWDNSAETNRAFHGKYLCTGDIACKDSEGNYYIVNRKKELIITGGENVLPSEVEAVLNRHPNIKDSIVVGYDNPIYGESVGAMIIIDGEFDNYEEALNEYCLERLAGYKTPKAYIVVKDFPKNSIGKYDRRKISQMIEEKIKQ